MHLTRRLAAAFALAALTVGAAPALALAASASGATAKVSSISTAECAANRAAGTIKFLSPFGYDASVGILDVYAAQQLGYFKELCLTVSFNGAFNPNVYADVSSGVGTITGEGSAADDLVAVAAGDRFTAVATFGDTSDYALLTRSSITKLTQLSGKTLADHGVLPVVLSEMLRAAKVDTKKVNVVIDNTYVPSLLIKGHYDALQAYQSNEPFVLDAEGYAKDFREWTPAQFKVHGTFNVQVVNSAFLAAHRQATADFLRAELHAFDYCETSQSTCVGFLAKAAGKSYSASHALQEWGLETKLATGHTLDGKGVGVQSGSEWSPELVAVMTYGLIKAPVRLAAVQDTTLAASLYHGKTLIWP